MEFSFNHQSKRARKARLRKSLANETVQALLAGLAIVLAFTTLFWPLAGNPLFALTLVPLTPIAMILLWYRGELAPLKPDAPLSDGRADALLDPYVLGRLPQNPAPNDLAQALSGSKADMFFRARFGLPVAEFASLYGDVGTADIWRKALGYAQERNGAEVSQMDLAAAIFTASPVSDHLLSQLKLDSGDIRDGAGWYQHHQQVFERFNTMRPVGGIGRDLAFGYAPLLNRIGNNISMAIQQGGLLRRELEGHDQVIEQMLHLLSSQGRQNVALVGELGVGKTTIVEAFAQTLLTRKDLPANLRYNQIVLLEAPRIISLTSRPGDLEQLLLALVNEAAKAKNIILFLDDAIAFLQQSEGSVNASNVLLNLLERTTVRVITSFTDKEWIALQQKNPALAQVLNRVNVGPLGRDDTMRVMEDQILLMESRYGVVYRYQALKEAYALAARFVQDMAFPGKALKLLESASGFSEGGLITAESVQKAVESSYNVRVQTAQVEDERDTLLNLEDKIHERMVNQTRAVKVVSDALRRARAGVRSTNRPIGTFLFLGPTGVGKTELSKSLADVYFGGEDRLVRLDLNEFSGEGDADKLIATAAENSRSLTAQVLAQPFSVVLLDEIEKAHDNVLNLLLQLLDEGILRDRDNREVSFRDAIIIATSNAGADDIRAHIDRGEQLEQFEEAFVNELIDKQVFRPEFLNRFDEIVLFRPLEQKELVQVVDLIMAGVNGTLADRKISVELTPEAKEWLAGQGYDPRLGARPLRRTVQRTVENVVAKRLLSGEAEPGSVVRLDVQQLEESGN